MASEKQIEANRKNAQHSTGPKSQDGKHRSRLNAVTHGLTGGVLDVLPHEDHHEFNRRLNAWFDDRRPTSEGQAHLVRQAAVISWKIDRADRYEIVSLSERVKTAVNPCFEEPLTDLDSEILNRVFIREAHLASFDPGNEAERLRRYQFSLHRALLRTLDALEKLKKAEEREKSATKDADEAESVPVEPVEEIKKAVSPRLSDRPSPNEAKSASSKMPNEAKSPRPKDWTFEQILSETAHQPVRNSSYLDISISPG